ncbi:MAG TPA: acyltransferase [Terracidiphilus sp.]|jgi:peptidoglycan/LPS O-acetylase OafA/YrhL|nr:acyltransferase [Terracidiphilus sp.]
MAKAIERSIISITPQVEQGMRVSPPRDFYIDRLRSGMTAMVLLHHTAITYGAPGGWFWYELHPSGSLSSLLLTLFVSTNQAYFMGFFFLLAGYFTPRSLERKGYARFIGDRFLRLGLPLLAFILILGPLTAGIANAGDGKGFWVALHYLWIHQRIINGPLWFAQALLIFSLGYCLWRAVAGRSLSDSGREPKPVPAFGWWLGSALAVGAAALAIRQSVPVGVNVFGLQLGYFASYTFLFALGIGAWRFDWLRQLRWKHARVFICGLALTWPLMPLAIVIARAFYGPGHANFSTGFSWPAIVYAFWEPFVAWGLIAAWLLLFRATMNRPSAFWDWLNRRAYAVYILHPPVLVALALWLRPLSAPALVKFAATGTLTCIATWLLADLLVRLPGAQRIV